MTSTSSQHRPPRALSPDDPALIDDAATTQEADAPRESERTERTAARGTRTPARPTAADLMRGFRWGSLLLSGLGGLLMLATTLWFTSYVQVALAREDWIGWLAVILLGIVGVSALAIILREIIGLFRLARLEHLRSEISEALSDGDLKRERRAIGHLKSILSSRADLHWALSRFAEHEKAVLSAGELLELADRELMEPLDQEARRVIVRAAKRVALVTAISPIAWIAMAYVLFENVRALRALAGLYGGRPGTLGALKLARMVIGHVIATGGVALTDDLMGQFLGQDLLRRLSTRLGEGAFNGALTARIGATAVEVCRPLPFIANPPIRARDILTELFRRASSEGQPS